MLDKHLYSDGVDTVIATSPEDAEIQWSNWVGDSRSPESDPLEQIDDNKIVSVYFDGVPKANRLPAGYTIRYDEEDDPIPDPYTVEISATAKAWADAWPEAWLCSTEF